MRAITSLTTIRAESAKAAQVIDIGHRISDLLGDTPGFHSYTTWQLDEEGDEFLGVGDYESSEVWKVAGAIVADSGILDDVIETIDPSQEFKLVNIEEIVGVRPGHVNLGEFLSLTDRRAEIGYGAELLDELGRILAELTVIEGLLGYQFGHPNASPDEVIGIALWKRKFAFENSLPEGRIHDVKLYSRIS